MKELTSTAEVIKKTFAIPESHLEGFKAGITKLQRRVQKLACGSISYAVGPQRYVTTAAGEDPITGALITRKMAVYDIEVSGDAPKLSGWRFIAAIEHDAEIGNIISVLPHQHLPEIYRNANLYNCDHCHKTIFRRDTFVVQSEASDEYKQVGRRCLRDFLGHKSPEDVARYFELIYALFSYGEAEENDHESHHDFFYDDLGSFLATTSAVIREFGWVSKKQAQEDHSEGHLCSTNERVRSQFYDIQLPAKFRIEITDDDKKAAVAAIEWFKNQNGDSDYIYNTKKLAEAGMLRPRHTGLAASMMWIYLREVERQKQLTEAPSEHFGEVGQRLPVGEAVWISTYGPIDNGYSPTFIYKFQAGNHILVWFTGTKLEQKVGNKVNIVKATIRRHSEYKGRKETVVSRVVLKPIADDSKVQGKNS